MDNKVIDVQIGERPLSLEYVDSGVAAFVDSKGYAFQMPRSTWSKKGRPGFVKVSGEVIL